MHDKLNEHPALPAGQRVLLWSMKQPRQARSADLVAAVLEAAVRVLAEEGAQRFTPGLHARGPT